MIATVSICTARIVVTFTILATPEFNFYFLSKEGEEIPKEEGISDLTADCLGCLDCFLLEHHLNQLVISAGCCIQQKPRFQGKTSHHQASQPARKCQNWDTISSCA